MLLCLRAAAAALLRRSHAACSSWLRLILMNALCVPGPLIGCLLLRVTHLMWQASVALCLDVLVPEHVTWAALSLCLLLSSLSNSVVVVAKRLEKIWSIICWLKLFHAAMLSPWRSYGDSKRSKLADKSCSCSQLALFCRVTTWSHYHAC